MGGIEEDQNNGIDCGAVCVLIHNGHSKNGLNSWEIERGDGRGVENNLGHCDGGGEGHWHGQ